MASRNSQNPSPYSSTLTLPTLSHSAPPSKRNSNSSGLGSYTQNRIRDSLATSGYGSGGFGNPTQNVTYGESTGTKGFGTGNDYEGSRRSPSVPGAYGYSTGTKGFGTGNDFERKVQRARATASPGNGGTPFGSCHSIADKTQQGHKN
ncbi:hypothetical protein VKT23_007949 [Stygiomarasmius scandens]|uniref:Uncharacterized protein n=1 Tax=Marasmiellus scandens TaxID=2682957 RepID=A0ABR1JIU6_9AGAR